MLSNDRKALFCVSVVTVLAIQPSAQQLVSTTQQSVSTTQQSVSTTQQSVSTTQQSVSTTQQLVSTTQQPVSTTQQSMSTAVIPTKCVPKIKPPGNKCKGTEYYDGMVFNCRPCSRCCNHSEVVSECVDGCVPSSHTCAEEDKCRVHCGPPPVLDQPTYKPSLKEYDEYDVVKYYCPPGYMLSENVTSQCVEPGNWYTVPPSCLKVYHCEQPPHVDSARYVPEKDKYDVMENITYSCADFHKLSGNMTVYCGPTGEWFNLPSCDLEVWKVVALCVGVLAVIAVGLVTLGCKLKKQEDHLGDHDMQLQEHEEQLGDHEGQLQEQKQNHERKKREREKKQKEQKRIREAKTRNLVGRKQKAEKKLKKITQQVNAIKHFKDLQKYVVDGLVLRCQVAGKPWKSLFERLGFDNVEITYYEERLNPFKEGMEELATQRKDDITAIMEAMLLTVVPQSQEDGCIEALEYLIKSIDGEDVDLNTNTQGDTLPLIQNQE